MNEKIMNQIAEMKMQTIGVEVEMNNITRKAAAQLAAEFFGTGRYEDTRPAPTSPLRKRTVPSFPWRHGK